MTGLGTFLAVMLAGLAAHEAAHAVVARRVGAFDGFGFKSSCDATLLQRALTFGPHVLTSVDGQTPLEYRAVAGAPIVLWLASLALFATPLAPWPALGEGPGAVTAAWLIGSMPSPPDLVHTFLPGISKWVRLAGSPPESHAAAEGAEIPDPFYYL